MPDADAMRGPIPGRRRLHDAELEWRPRTWTQANTESVKYSLCVADHMRK